MGATQGPAPACILPGVARSRPVRSLSFDRGPGVAVLPSLSSAHWPSDAYRRRELPERVLQFGTGMLLRAICAASVDAANRAGRFNGRVLVVQSTPHGTASALHAQDGLFTLVERGLWNGAPVERTRLVGAVSRALIADAQWRAVREAVTQPQLQVIVSNVTEAGFRLDDAVSWSADDGAAPPSFPAKLTDVLHARFARLPDGPPVYVIPTELVPDNGARLAAMVDRVAAGAPDAQRFRDWLARRVRFCSSLVDRITTGAPPERERAALEARLGYADALLTVAEPYSFWAIEGDPDALRAAFAIDGSPESVVFAPDIGMYAERKLRLLNGAHTALAPLALLAGARTVREAAEDPRLGPFLRRVLFDELVPGTALPAPQAQEFAASVLERFRNPWLEHEWRVIATNQTAKMRLRVAPAIERFTAGRGGGEAPLGLALACAAHLRYLRAFSGATGWWRGATYPIVDADLALVARHWQAVLPDSATQPAPPAALERLVARALADPALWGTSLAQVPGFLEACRRSLVLLERDGVDAALSHD
jgi:tagaturonate reductase